MFNLGSDAQETRDPLSADRAKGVIEHEVSKIHPSPDVPEEVATDFLQQAAHSSWIDCIPVTNILLRWMNQQTS